MSYYKDLIDAVRILATANREISLEDGPSIMSPAWKINQHAIWYLEKQADFELRGE